MPTYSYACTECDNKFDMVQAFSDDALTECPQCDGRLRKLFGKVGVVFKGSGFYRTDSREAGQERVQRRREEQFRVLEFAGLDREEVGVLEVRQLRLELVEVGKQLELLDHPRRRVQLTREVIHRPSRRHAHRAVLLPSVAAWGNHSIRRC